MAEYEVPLISEPQTFGIALAGINYQLLVTWNANSAAWLLDIAAADGTPMVQGIALMPGVDLLEPYSYLNFGGSLFVETNGDLYAPPTRNNLGLLGKLYFSTP